MKSYIFFAVVLLAIIACNQKTETTTARNTVIDTNIDVDTNTSVSSNSIQLNNYIQALTFIIEYDSLNNVKMSESGYRAFFTWLISIKENSLFQDLYLTETRNSIVIEIEAITTKQISFEIATQRSHNIITILNSILGTDAEDIPVFKTLNYLKYGKRNDNYIKISFNRMIH